MSDVKNLDRRAFLQSSSVLLGVAAPGTLSRIANAAPALITPDAVRPRAEQGLSFGDVTYDRAIVWSRSDRPSRLIVEYDYDERFRRPRRIRGPHALDVTDYTARVDLIDLQPGATVHVRSWFEDLTHDRATSEPVIGHFTTPSRKHGRDIRFVWGGDTAGQGYGINPDIGGMRIYEAMRRVEPQFFAHLGDNIYADGPIDAEKLDENANLWRNLVTEEVAKVAETLAEFRGRYRYNLLDANLRRFNAEVPQIWLWDDHEVLNNWSDSKDLTTDARYTVKDVPLLVARASRAFQEYSPQRYHGLDEAERIYRQIPYGPLLDLFALDLRSYRGPNSFNRQEQQGPDTAYLGRAQLDWLKHGLERSGALWKVILSDMPIGLVVGDGTDAQGRPHFENNSNGDGAVLGREFEIAEILRFIKHRGIRNVIWLTADVHYAAAHYYNPNTAVFQDFDPFWEFVAGPLNAGTFGPNPLDNTFGPEVVFQKVPALANSSPAAGLQFFGEVNIASRSGILSVELKDLDGKSIFKQKLTPAGNLDGCRSSD